MVYQPSKTLGLAVGLGALLGLLTLCAGCLVLLATQPPSPLSLALLALVVAAAPAIGWLAYRLAGLANARYILSPGALTVEWGGRREVIPLADLEEAHAGAEYPGELHPPRLAWPGCVVGLVQHPALGAVEFLATTAEKARLVLLGYPGGWLVLSPPKPAAFLAALTAGRTDASAEDAVELTRPESAYPDLPRWALWKDRLALGLITAAGLGWLALAVYLVSIAPQLPAEIALRFDPAGQPQTYGPPAGLFNLVLIGASAWGLNVLLGAGLHRREADRAAAYLLWGGGLAVQALVWIAAVSLLTAGA
ncbi:MAG: hypothetical protein JNK29_03415 [Anaerolineales bacterium]|nr:hypothetical protein [Anaerolineales bacterium]